MRQREKRQLVFVLPDGKEHFADLESLSENWKIEYERESQMAVTRSGLTAPRDQPKRVQVRVYQLVINKGVLERRNAYIATVDVPLARMTDKDYAAEIKDVLTDLPAAFHSFVESYAYQHGHAYGYEEVVSIARNLTSELLPSVKAYTKELENQHEKLKGK